MDRVIRKPGAAGRDMYLSGEGDILKAERRAWAGKSKSFKATRPIFCPDNRTRARATKSEKISFRQPNIFRTVMIFLIWRKRTSSRKSHWRRLPFIKQNRTISAFISIQKFHSRTITAGICMIRLRLFCWYYLLCGKTGKQTDGYDDTI